MSRFRDIKRRARGDLHEHMSIPAFYYSAADVEPVECLVRVWLKTDEMTGDLQGFNGAERAEPEDRVRFDLSEFTVAPRRLGVVSIAADEAYRIDHLYPADLGYQTARVVRLTAADITAGDYEVPE